MIRSRLTALLGVAALGVLAACSPADPDPSPAVSWEPCGADGAVQCATVPVPVDRADPGGPTIDIAVARMPARDPGRRRGTLVLHVGGPAPSRPVLLDPGRRAGVAELAERFDVVTFDSRGYGASAGTCDPGLAPPIAVLDSPEALDAHREHQARYAESCRAGAPDLVEHVSAADAADDIDDIRAALGEDRIAFFGNSYGTVFGQAYAQRHGTRLSRLYLDSVVDHTASTERDRIDRAAAGDVLLERFAVRCTEDPECAPGEDPLRLWDDVVARAPLPVEGGPALRVDEIRMTAPSMAETDPRGYAAALLAARDGDARPLAAPMRQAPAGGGDAGQLTNCADFPLPDDYAALAAGRVRATEVAPRTGPAPTVEDWRCAGWPLPGTNPPGPLVAPEAPPALVVNSTLDPATHLAGARRVADALGSGAVLAVDGFTHAVYLGQPDNRCVRDTVHRYLLDGELPGPGASCGSEQPTRPAP